MSQCKHCQAEIRWAPSDDGGWIPLDAHPYTGRQQSELFVIRPKRKPGGGRGIVAVGVPPAAFPAGSIYRLHRCPPGGPRRGL